MALARKDNATMAEDNPQGIASDAEKKAAYITALERELTGYDMRIAQAEQAGDEIAKARYENRAQQVKDELARAKGGKAARSAGPA